MSDSPSLWNSGINSGHVLKFGDDMGTNADVSSGNLNSNTVNYWTNSAAPRQGIVDAILANSGYPTLVDSLGGESLAYLFDSQSSNGKQAYLDVDGLLQIDGNGYYYYNSQENFAEYDSETNSFILYDRAGVDAAGQSPDGQFFPFNTGSQVFSENGANLVPEQIYDGSLNNNHGGYRNVNSTDSFINHYFGLSMSTRFVQQYGGHTAKDEKQEVTYNFSGDDDVWVFIDGVLVGDLGGIHNATALEINFSTGMVYVYHDANNNNEYDSNETVYNGNGEGQTLKSLFEAARVEGVNWSGDTFADGTYHTLNFFYLERGNTDSNMSLKYNLVNIPESGVLKIDQDGNTIEGVSFALYPADENYSYSTDSVYYTGTTDVNGELVFTTSNVSGDEMPVTLEQLNEISDYWVLVETDAPEGYRNPGEMHLRFEDGVLLSSNEWDTGAYSQPHVTATASNTIYAFNSTEGTSYSPAEGTMFAVVLQKQSNGNWAPISGDAFQGWTVGSSMESASTVTESVIAAAQANPYQFVLGSGGAYEVDIENLPGDILTYEYMLVHNGGNASDAEYTVAYYWTSASSISGATTGNTVRLNSDDFDRVFSVTLNISNVKNELTLEKTDSLTGEPVAGATYALYADADGNGVADDDVAINTMTTDGNGVLNVANANGLLPNGTYVLVETAAPEGYALDTTPIQIVVDDDGVHVNAGTDDDNISVETGLGTLVYSMRGFAAGDNVDGTLHDVKAQPQSSETYGGSAVWADVADASALHFQYDNTSDNLSYVPYTAGDETASAATYTAEAGWSRLNVTQCTDTDHDGTGGVVKQELGAQSLNRLFTGDVTVHVTDDPLGTLVVSKDVVGGVEGETFNFTVVLTDMDGNLLTGAYPAQVYGADGQPVGEAFSISNDDPDTGGAENAFSLADGQYVVISGLPVDGVQFQVVEAASEGYVTDVEVSKQSVSDATDGSADDASGTSVLDAVRSILTGDTATDADADADAATDASATETAAPSDGTDASRTATGTVEASGMVTVAYTNTRAVSLDAAAALAVTKNLSGHNLSGTEGSAAHFSFTVTPVDTVDESTGEPVVTTTAAEAAAKIGTVGEEGSVSPLTFSNTDATMDDDTDGDGVADTATCTMNPLADGLTFTGADIGKTFTYQVAEVVPADGEKPAGYTYDTATHTVAYTVGQRADGTLYVSAQVDGTPVDVENGAVPTVVFTNAYVPEETSTSTDPESTTALRVQKTVSGTETDADFTFKLSLKEGDASAVYAGTGDDKTPFGDGTSATVGAAFNETDGMTHTAAFDAITFTKAGIYTFEVREDISDPETPNGWTYDNDNARTVTVKVEDNDGELAITSITYDNGTATTKTDRAVNNAAAFTNSYTADVTIGPDTDNGIRVQKTLTGRAWTEDDAFTFTLEAVTEGAPMPEESTVTVDAAAGTGAGTVVTGMFGNITYSKADLNGQSSRTFKYRVTENLPEGAVADDDGTYTLDGVTYDRHTSTVRVTVTDNGDGTMKAEVTYGNNTATTASDVEATTAAAFTNSYTAASDAEAKVTVAGLKTLENAGDASIDGFHFVLDPASDADAANLGFATSNSNGAFSFTLHYGVDSFTDAATVDPVTGLRSETFTYDAYEMSGGAVIDGISYDATHYTVKVTVTDNGDGTMGAAVASVVRADGTSLTPDADGIYTLAFTNTYTGSDKTSVSFGLQKVLDGRDLTADDGFSFEVRTYSVETGLAGDVVATGSTQGGSAADGALLTVTTTPYWIDSAAMAEAAEAGRVTDNGDGSSTARFDFAIEEVVGGNLNVGYSDATYYASVYVRNDGNGNLSVESVTYYRDATMTDALAQGELPTFTNTYLPDATNFALTGTKTTTAAEGVAVPDGLTFSYDVYQVGSDGSEMYVTSATSPANGTFTATIPVQGTGTYTYRIAESRGGTVQGGVTYDGTVYYLVLTATRDEATGVLQFDAAYYRGSIADENRLQEGEQVSFTNGYGDTYGAAVQLAGTKTLSGDAALSDLDPFTFSVTDVTDADNPRSMGNGVSNGDGTITFPTLTYTYYLQEQAADTAAEDGSDAADGQTDATDATEGVEGEAPADGAATDGTVTAEIPAADDDAAAGEAPADTPAETEPAADAGSSDAAAEQPAPSDGSDQAGVSDGSIDAAAPSDGAASVDPAGEAAAETPVTETPAVETVTTEPDATADAGVQEASIADLFAVSEAIADDTPAETISADVPSQDALAEALDAAATQLASEAVDTAEPAGTEAAADVSADAAVSSDPVIVSDDLGEHRYLIAENHPADAQQNEDGTWTADDGVTYDGTRYLVTVNVEASYDAAMQTSSMTAEVTEVLRSDSHGSFENATTVDPGSIAFANSYAASQPAAVSLTGTKTLTGRAMEAGEFSFEVYEGETLVTTGTNDADGTISFATFRVSEPGTHTYTVVETDAGEGGMTYDETSYQVTVEVVDNYDGTLSANVAYPEGGIVFANSYSTDGSVATATLEGTKTLTGLAMEAGEFSFAVTETTDGASKVVTYGESTAADDGAASAIDFTPIQYDQVGEHDYTVTEVAGGADGVTYDAASYRVHVSVVDNGDGTLAAQVTYPDGPIAFTNAYEGSEEPSGPSEPTGPSDSGDGTIDDGTGSGDGTGTGSGTIPRTGDATDLAGAAALALGGLGAALLGGGALLRRRAGR